MTDQTAPDIEPTSLPAALVELRHARVEIARLKPFVAVADGASRAAEHWENEAKRWLAFIQRGMDTHTQFSLLHPDGTIEKLPCADWCYACRIEKSEAGAQRVSALYERWLKSGAPPLGTSVSRWWDTRLVELRTALDESSREPAAVVHPEPNPQASQPRTVDEQPGQTPVDSPPGLREQLHAAIEYEVYEYRERTTLWSETEGVTEEITRLATRGALTVHDRLAADLETADRIRAEAQRDRDQHAAVLREVLAAFVHKVEGYRIPRLFAEADVVTLEKWRSVVAPTVERPWWETVAELREDLKRAEAAIARVRALHSPVEWRGMTVCAECSALDANGGSTDNRPVQHEHCGTVAALAESTQEQA